MIIQGDALAVLKTLDDESVNMCVTSPPYYGLRDYGIDGQIGLEETPEKYIDRLVSVFREVRRVMKDDGTLWVNVGDSYANDGKWGGSTGGKAAKGLHGNTGIGRRKVHTGLKQKDLIGIPWMLAFALRDDGWYLRQDIIWHKPNPMPESVKDRCTKSHEYIFLLSKSAKYYFDNEAICEPATQSTMERIAQDVENQHGSVIDGGIGYSKPVKAFSLQFQKPKHPIGGIKRGEQDDEHFRTSSGNDWKPTAYRNKRDVWSITTKPYSGAHFATFPEALVEPCILAGSNRGGVVLDPFNGAATTGVVCLKNGREYIGIELNPEYVEISEKRLAEVKEIVENERAQMNLFSDFAEQEEEQCVIATMQD